MKDVAIANQLIEFDGTVPPDKLAAILAAGRRSADERRSREDWSSAWARGCRSDTLAALLAAGTLKVIFLHF